MSPAALPANANAASAPPAIVVSLPVDGAVIAAGGLAWIGSELARDALAPDACRWCAPGRFDASARDALRWSTPGTADALSSIGAFALAPIAAFGLDALAEHEDDRGEAPPPRARATLDDAVVILESAVVAMDLNQATKLVVARERPYAWARLQAGGHDESSQDRVAFFSGHATFAFTLAAASGTVASMRALRLAPVVWGVGEAIAVSTAYLRVAADAHWVSDVLTGAAVGSAVGVVVPLLFHAAPRPLTALRVVPGPSGSTLVGWVGRW